MANRRPQFLKKIQIIKRKGHKDKIYFSRDSCSIPRDVLKKKIEQKTKLFKKIAAAIMLLHYRPSGAEAVHPFCLFSSLMISMEH